MGRIDPETGIWKIELAKRHQCDLTLAAAIACLYKPKAVADLGCGHGRYCAIFEAYGWPTVHGYEGTPDINKLGIYKDIMFIDLTKRRVVGINYDLVICLEVGEHVPPQHEQAFLDNVSAFARKNLVISWAIPGQYSASGHVNCRPHDYVIDQLAKRGLIFDKKRTKFLRAYSRLKWFKTGVMVFARKEI
jgi:2-polyprenyl-3-methyl-5-hydroxy-6-metoxy-1,4-benzoquinol methylase